MMLFLEILVYEKKSLAPQGHVLGVKARKKFLRIKYISTQIREVASLDSFISGLIEFFSLQGILRLSFFL